MANNENCPFCGGEPILMYQFSAKRRCYFGWVECQSCGARTRTKEVYGEPGDDGFYGQGAYQRLWYLWSRRDGKEDQGAEQDPEGEHHDV